MSDFSALVTFVVIMALFACSLVLATIVRATPSMSHEDCVAMCGDRGVGAYRVNNLCSCRMEGCL